MIMQFMRENVRGCEYVSVSVVESFMHNGAGAGNCVGPIGMMIDTLPKKTRPFCAWYLLSVQRGEEKKIF